MKTTKLLIISILLVIGCLGCDAIAFIECGDRGVCNEKWGGLVNECCK